MSIRAFEESDRNSPYPRLVFRRRTAPPPSPPSRSLPVLSQVSVCCAVWSALLPHSSGAPSLTLCLSLLPLAHPHQIPCSSPLRVARSSRSMPPVDRARQLAHHLSTSAPLAFSPSQSPKSKMPFEVVSTSNAPSAVGPYSCVPALSLSAPRGKLTRKWDVQAGDQDRLACLRLGMCAACAGDDEGC